MTRRHWTLMLVRDGSPSMRQVRLSTEWVQGTIATALILLSVLTSLGAGVLIRGGNGTRAGQLERENQLLRERVEDIQEDLGALQLTLDELSDKDAKYRLLAGLEPVDFEPLTPAAEPRKIQTLSIWRVSTSPVRASVESQQHVGAMLQRARSLSSSWQEATDTLERKYARFAATPSILPTHGFLSSTFTRQRWHPILDRPRPHEGIDIAAPHGTPIVAAARGVVRFAGTEGDYGLMVEIDHGHGYVTRYAHASKARVKRGDLVERGQTIGNVGSSGLAIGPHLHYEVLLNGRPVDPRNYILAGPALPD